MNLSLSNTLGKRMAINPDGLSLDLAFALDKTLVARKGPTPTFTRASTATFVGSNGLIQSAGINNARFDHDPVTLDCKGLLIEEARTNLATRSQEFENAVYGRASVGVAAATITANNDTAPDGTLTADLVSFSATTAINQQGILFRTVHTATIGEVVTLSIFLRVPSGTATVFIALSEGAPQTGQSVACNVTTTWQRFSVTRTALVATSIFIELGPDTRAFMGQTVVQPAASVLLWGAQFELGAFPTSYIPTKSVALTRSADVCSITGANFTSFYNQSEGTLFADATPQTVNQVAFVLGLNTFSFQDQQSIFKSDSTAQTAGKRWVAQTVSVGIAQSTIATSSDIAVSRGILSYAYKLNDMAFAANGTLVGTDNNGTMPTSTTMRIGGRDDGIQLNGHLARIQYFRKRLPNAKLVTLTT